MNRTADSLAHEGALGAAHIRTSADEAADFLYGGFKIEGRLSPLVSEKDDSFRVDASDGRKYVLKIANPSEDLLEIDFQIKLLLHVAKVNPNIPVPRLIRNLDGRTSFTKVDRAGQNRSVRLMSFLDGTLLDSTGSTAQERFHVGEVLGRLRHATAGFSHPADSRFLAWDVKNLPSLRPLLDHVDDVAHRKQLTRGMDRFVGLQDRISALRTQVLHNDFSKSNIVVDHANPQFVTGIIDFGDSVRTAVAIDVSTALLNQLPRNAAEVPVEDLFADARDVLRGYLSVAELTPAELQLIPHLVMGRVVGRALITLWRAKLIPENSTYTLRNTEQGWAQLDWFLKRSVDEVSSTLVNAVSQGIPMNSAIKRRGKMNNGFDPTGLTRLDSSTRAAIERRTRLLGPAYRLFYQNPVEFTHGKGVLLYDKAGNEYLDAYNNVVSIGHGNPRVADAVHRQMQTLCTHTRYLQEGILEYAEDLLATFGGRIGKKGHAMFTCTGSEANDLAVRIAKHHTGKRGIIVTAEAYHGNSDMGASFSPALGEHSPLGAWVRRVPTPDSYRLPTATMARWFADQVAAQIEDLERHGDGLAAFVVDSLFTSDGIFSHPTDLLAPVAEVVRQAGGVFIVDEVQCGFARTGEKFWGYQRHGIDPDIVSMGKPMGNGFPVAGIAVAAEIVAKFGQDTRYFNTFGGNTVAIAAAQATLDVMREEKLAENAEKIGQLMCNGLKDIAARYEGMGDVRGAGLYIGVEMVKDRTTKEPDAAAASAMVNGLRERRVLISVTGFHANTLKIRPPLIFSAENVTRLLTEFETVAKSQSIQK